MAIEKVLLGETVAEAVEKVNELIDVVVATSDTVEDIVVEGTKSVKKAEQATDASNVRVNNIDNATSPRPIAIAASGMNKSPIFVDADDLNYTPSTGVLRAPKLSENGTLIESKYATKDELQGVATTAGKIDDVKVNGTSVVSNKVANITVPTENELNSKFIPASQKGAKNGVATLGSDGLIIREQIPDRLDDVLEGYYDEEMNTFYKDEGKTESYTPASGLLYIDLNSRKIYRWSGSLYAVVSETLALGETSDTAYSGLKGRENREDINALQSRVSGLGNAVATIGNSIVSSIYVTFSTSAVVDENGYYEKSFHVNDLDSDGNISIDSFIPTLVLSGTGAQLSSRLVDWYREGVVWVMRSHIVLSNAIAVFIKTPVVETSTINL